MEVKSKEKEKSPELEKGIQNKDKKKSKQEQWEVSLSDDSWYRAPTFHPEVVLRILWDLKKGIFRVHNPEEQILKLFVRSSMHMENAMMMVQQPLDLHGYSRCSTEQILLEF